MENILFYNKKATHFEEALPIGNGRIGAAVYGNLKKERIALNEDTLWSGYPKDKNNHDAYKYVPELREAVFSKDYKHAEELLNGVMHGQWTECYLPFGDIVIDYKNVPRKNYRRSLNIETGVAQVSADGFCQTCFVSHPAQLLVIRITSESGISFSVKLDSQLKHTCTCDEDTLIMSGQAPEVCMPSYYSTDEPVVQGDKGMRFCGAVRVLGNAEFANDEIRVENRKETVLLVSLATSFVDFKSMPDADERERALSYFDNIKLYEQLLNEHIADFSSLFNRVSLTLEGDRSDLPTDKRIKRMKHHSDDNGLVALLFQYGRYLTISASRSGTAAMNLQGIWNIHLRAPWSSNYTTNINTQMNYWCTDSANLSECFEPLVDLVKKLYHNGYETAATQYGCKGFCAHHNSDIWGATQQAGDPEGKSNSISFAPWCMSVPWLLAQLYEHYLYTGDEDYKKELVPMFEGCLEFYKDYLVEHNGELVTCPSISPENVFADGDCKTAVSYMTSMDREILFDFFRICRILGLDAPEINQVKPASDGRIPEWIEEYKETDVEHRHVSHLYCIYPSCFEQSQELKAAAEKSLLTRGFGGTGWSLGWKVCLWARLGNAENAFRLIRQQLTYINPNININRGGGTYPNMLDAHPPFQIDGNFGVTAGIAEMFRNEAIPEEWTGEIHGLKAYGGREISYSFKNGKRIS